MVDEYIKNFRQKIFRKTILKLRKYMYYKKLIFINKTKFNYTFLQYLKRLLENVFNKNVEFNIINLKRLYYNSDIFTDIIETKISKNRSKLH